MDAQRIVYLVEFCALFGVWSAVVVTYHVMTGGAWKRSPEGRHVMIFGLIFVWVSALTLANILFGRYPGRFVIGVTSYGLFVLIGAQRWAMIVKAQRQKRAQISKARNAISRSSSEPPR